MQVFQTLKKVYPRTGYEGLEEEQSYKSIVSLTLSLLMLYTHGTPCKARNFNVVYRVFHNFMS
jgi:hypothetical protein